MTSTVLSEKRKEGLSNLIERCQRHVKIDADYLLSIANDPDGLAPLRDRWYESLPDKPDYSVYSADEYIVELWDCWITYSRKYLNAIQKPSSFPPYGLVKSLPPIKTVVDLGCGAGYTTAALTEIFPDAQVFGTNIDGTLQMAVACDMAHEHGFTMRNYVDEIGGPIDLVFASEYFEHIYEPLDHLLEVINTLQPKCMLIANAFGQIAIGHFLEYGFDYKKLSAKATSSWFTTIMKSMGYVKVKTKLWNNRPALWFKT